MKQVTLDSWIKKQKAKNLMLKRLREFSEVANVKDGYYEYFAEAIIKEKVISVDK